MFGGLGRTHGRMGSAGKAGTGAGGDLVAPVLTSPTDTKTSDTTADLTVTTDENNGTLYAVSVLAGSTPSKGQVKLGKDSTGAAAGYAGSQAIASTGVKTISATGLTASTHYLATYFMHEDAASNQSNVVAADGFTTDAASGGTAGQPLGLLLILTKAA